MVQTLKEHRGRHRFDSYTQHQGRFHKGALRSGVIYVLTQEVMSLGA